MAGSKPRSLRRRLIVQLLLLQAAVLIVVATAFIVYVAQAVGNGTLSDPGFTETVARALVRNEDGSVQLTETKELKELRAAIPDLWFVARVSSGEIVREGQVPAIYEAIAGRLDRISFADIRDTGSSHEILAIVRNVSGPTGNVTVLGRGKLVSMTYAVFFLANLLVVPIMVLLTIITAVTIPMIVGRTFKRLANVAREAKTIDIDRRGYRLPVSDVPSEILPMVDAINGALGRLDDGYERQRRFILDAAHELRTPIAILQTRIAAMPVDDYKTKLQTDTARIAGLAEQLLDMHRIGRDDMPFRGIDLAQLCRAAVADLAPLAIAAGYELSLEEPGRPIIVNGDSGSLERVVTNLIQNSIEHGGGRGRIALTVTNDGAIEVADDGPGVPEAERENIFAPFHRLHPRAGGAGLGLSLAREIAIRHGGHLAVVDHPGGGACFRLTLPLAH